MVAVVILHYVVQCTVLQGNALQRVRERAVAAFVRLICPRGVCTCMCRCCKLSVPTVSMLQVERSDARTYVTARGVESWLRVRLPVALQACRLGGPSHGPQGSPSSH